MIYLKLFFTFFKIGLFTFGGGYAMIPMITQDVVANNWLTFEEVTEFIGIAESTPGPFAINIATFVGMNEGGILGALCTTLGVVAPSFIVIYIIAKIFSKYMNNNKYVDGAFSMVRPIIVGLIGVAFVDILLEVFVGGVVITDTSSWKNIINIDLVAVIIAEIVYLLSRYVKKFSAIWLVITSAVLGMAFYSLADWIIV